MQGGGTQINLPSFSLQGMGIGHKGMEVERDVGRGLAVQDFGVHGFTKQVQVCDGFEAQGGGIHIGLPSVVVHGIGIEFEVGELQRSFECGSEVRGIGAQGFEVQVCDAFEVPSVDKQSELPSISLHGLDIEFKDGETECAHDLGQDDGLGIVSGEVIHSVLGRASCDDRQFVHSVLASATEVHQSCMQVRGRLFDLFLALVPAAHERAGHDDSIVLHHDLVCAYLQSCVDQVEFADACESMEHCIVVQGRCHHSYGDDIPIVEERCLRGSRRRATWAHDSCFVLRFYDFAQVGRDSLKVRCRFLGERAWLPDCLARSGQRCLSCLACRSCSQTKRSRYHPQLCRAQSRIGGASLL